MTKAPAPSPFPSLRDSAPPAGPPRWHARLLGSVDASDGARTLQRFPSRAVAALLARLAVAPERAHAREELVELLWPGVELAVGRNRLRQALSTLKSLLEDGATAGADTVLTADRVHVRVVPGALGSDVQEFERLARAGQHAEARALYRGEFMPGFYEEWIDEMRLALAATFERVEQRLAAQGAAQAPAQASAHDSAQLRAGSSPRVPAPPPPAARTPLHRLPHYVTSLVGAEAVLQALGARVREHRLVTLVGPGGSGKTRLAVEAAHRLAASGAAAGPFDLVAFVPLAACTTRGQLEDALAGALQRPGGADTVASLVEGLAGRRVLLVLDNLEQVVEAAQAPLARLLAELPQLHVLATSRRLLALDGEHGFVAPALPLPSPQAGLAEAAGNPALALFVERARAARADFHLGARNAPTLVRLVRALEGLPLAIELAACRVRSIAPAEMLERLQAGGTPRLDLLERGGPRAAADARHASMLRVIEWSWSQLGPEPARLLAALTVFPGGFTHAAAQTLWDGVADPPTEPASPPVRRREGEAAQLLDELAAHSMLTTHADAEDERMRFAMYEPIREFAATKLDEAGRRRLRTCLRRWAATWASALPQTPPLAEVRAEMPNLVAALASAVHDEVPHEAIELLLVLRRCLEDVELPAEGLALAQQALAQVADARLAARGHSLVGPLLFTAGQAAAANVHAEQGLACESLSASERARALHALARVRWRSRTQVNTVEPLLDEADALLGSAGSGEAQPHDLRASLTALRAFVVNRLHGRLTEGERLHAQALAGWERSGNQHAIDSGRYNLAVCAQNAGRHRETLERLAPVIEGARARGDWRRLGQSLNVRGNAHCGLRAWAEAADDYRECIRIAWRGMSSYDLAHGLWNLPRALLHLRRAPQGVPIAAFAEVHWQANFGALSGEDERELVRLRRLGARLLTPREFEALWRQGAALGTAQAVALALES